jgi:hypothetical protein
MRRKAVFDSCRRVVIATCTVPSRYKSTGPTGTCMHRTFGVADSGSTISSTIADDQVSKKSESQESRAASKVVKVDEQRPVLNPCSMYSEFATTSTTRDEASEVATTTPAESRGVAGAPSPQQPLNEGSASKSKVYEQFNNSSISTIASNRKNKCDARHHHQANTTKNQNFITLGPRLKSPVKNHGARMKHALPVLNASALFQSQLDDSSDTRQELLHVIREECMRKRRRPFVMTGHAVPPQLFQDHLQMADSFLRQENAVECSFNNYHDHLTVDNMYVKHGLFRV